MPEDHPAPQTKRSREVYLPLRSPATTMQPDSLVASQTFGPDCGNWRSTKRRRIEEPSGHDAPSVSSAGVFSAAGPSTESNDKRTSSGIQLLASQGSRLDRNVHDNSKVMKHIQDTLEEKDAIIQELQKQLDRLAEENQELKDAIQEKDACIQVIKDKHRTEVTRLRKKLANHRTQATFLHKKLAKCRKKVPHFRNRLTVKNKKQV